MKQLLLVFGLLISAAIWLTGCAKASDNQLVPRVAGGAQKPTDRTSTKPGDKAADPTYNTRRQLMRALQQSHQIFEEGWKVAYGKEYSTPISIFKVFYQRLAKHGFILKEAHRETIQDCPFYISTVVQKELGATLLFKNYEYRVSDRKCGDNNEEEFFVAKALGSNTFEISAKASQRNLLKVIGPQTHITAKGDIVCQMKLEEKTDRLINLACKNLGHSLRKDSNSEDLFHTSFDKFEYNQKNKDILLLEATHYKNGATNICKDQKQCLSMFVPMTGRIQIIEYQPDVVEKINDLKTTEVKDKVSPTQAPAAGTENGEQNGQNQNPNGLNSKPNDSNSSQVRKGYPAWQAHGSVSQRGQGQNSEVNAVSNPENNQGHGLEFIESPGDSSAQGSGEGLAPEINL